VALASKLEIEQVAIAPNKMDWSKTSKEALMARLTIIRLHHFLETNPANLSVTVLQYSRLYVLQYYSTAGMRWNQKPEGLKVGTLLIGLEGRCLHRSTTLAYCYRAN
jgi:hypothetical protein